MRHFHIQRLVELKKDLYAVSLTDLEQLCKFRRTTPSTLDALFETSSWKFEKPVQIVFSQRFWAQSPFFLKIRLWAPDFNLVIIDEGAAQEK